MSANIKKNGEQGKEHLAMKTPPIVSQQEWEAAREQLLVKEKTLMHARDAMAAERRRMPWMAVEKKYMFDGPNGKVSLLDLFEGCRQLIVYRAFFEPGAAAVDEVRAEHLVAIAEECMVAVPLRGDGDYLELPRYDGARPAGDLGGFAGGLPADPAV